MGKYPQDWLDNLLLKVVSTLATDDDAEDDQGNSVESSTLLEIGRHDLLGLVEQALRLRKQRDRAWMTLNQVKEALGADSTPTRALAFILAGATTAKDCDDWNALLEATEGKLENIKELPSR